MDEFIETVRARDSDLCALLMGAEYLMLKAFTRAVDAKPGYPAMRSASQKKPSLNSIPRTGALIKVIPVCFVRLMDSRRVGSTVVERFT